MSTQIHIELLELVHEKLEELVEEVVFIGGITTFLYVDLSIADEVRPTDDIDCVIEVTNKNAYDEFQEKLRGKGFTHDTRKEAPICRFKHGDLLTIDVMPSDPTVLGFSNRWYPEGIRRKCKVKIKEKEFDIFPIEYFLASKFEAFNNRGHDPRQSWDLEDIVFVLDGVRNFEIKSDDTQLMSFLSKMSKMGLENRALKEAIEGFLSHDAEKIMRVEKRLKMMATLP